MRRERKTPTRDGDRVERVEAPCPTADVVEKGGEPDRLVTDGGYINLWIKYHKLVYEQLKDIPPWLSQWPGAFGTATDASNGFHHMSLDPRFWTYVGIQIKGKTFVFTVPAFGESE